MTTTSTDYVGSKDAALMLGWSLTKVKREAQAGRLPYAMKMGGHTGAYLFHRTFIEAIAEEVAA